MPIIAIALVLAAALGGGTAVVAQQATPGTPLYGFKTNVDEQVESMFAFNPQAKANVDISLANERLQEAQDLALQGTLTPSAQSQLEANFQAHTQDVSTQITKLQASGDYQDAADIAAKLESTLAEQSSAMTSASAHADASVQASLAPLMSTVRTELDDASSLSAAASTDAATEASTSSTAEPSDTGSSTEVSGDASAHVGGRMWVRPGFGNGTSTTQTGGETSGGVHVNIY